MAVGLSAAKPGLIALQVSGQILRFGQSVLDVQVVS